MVKTAALCNDTAAPAPAAAKRNGGKRAYKGVRMRSWGSWVSEVRAPGAKARIWLGSHSTAEAAARAYDAALLCLRGSAAAADLNFPVQLPVDGLPSATAMSPKSIQRVAAAAAAAGATAFASRADDVDVPCCSGDDSAPACSSSGGTEALSVSSPGSTVTSGTEPDAACCHGDQKLRDGDVDCSLLADIDEYFPSPKCMEYAMMDPCSAFFAPAPMAMMSDDEVCLMDEGDIALWAFSPLDC